MCRNVQQNQPYEEVMPPDEHQGAITAPANQNEQTSSQQTSPKRIKKKKPSRPLNFHSDDQDDRMPDDCHGSCVDPRLRIASLT